MEGVKSFSAAYFDDEESVREWATGLYYSQLSGHCSARFEAPMMTGSQGRPTGLASYLGPTYLLHKWFPIDSSPVS